ncbi:MAG: hypothetical protein QM820_61985 [Minicystis sp.]
MQSQLEGPLADWVTRLEALALKLRRDPRVNVTFFRVAGITDDALARLAARWKVGRFAPAVENLYRQANGLCLLWIATHHPCYPLVRERWAKSGFCGGFSTEPRTFAHMPTPQQVSDFAGYIWNGPDAPPHGDPPHGIIYLPPLEKVLGGSSSMFPTSTGVFPPDHERTFFGKVWKGNTFEEALRVFDYPEDYSPAAFVMEEGVADPPVVLAEDYTAWDDGPATTFERYLEHVLATMGLRGARRAWFRAGASEPPRALDSRKHPAPRDQARSRRGRRHLRGHRHRGRRRRGERRAGREAQGPHPRSPREERGQGAGSQTAQPE